MKNKFIITSIEVVILIVFAIINITFAGFIKDKIIYLPGYNQSLNFDHYSGYLDGENGDQLHYWFVTSQHEPKSDPVLLWLNGGPGCSSMDGLLTELGPYRINDDGETLSENLFAWNNKSNVLFLESPVCVGFSYREDQDCSASDKHTSLTNYMAIKSFFKKFPEFVKNPLFITGESYGGIYVPTLTQRIVKGDNGINIQGFAVGNGMSDYQMNDNSIIFFAYYHGLIGNDLWDSLVESCCTDSIPTRTNCRFSSSVWPRCNNLVQNASELIYNSGLNMYNMYGDCLHPSTNTNYQSSSRYNMDQKNIFRNFKEQMQKYNLLNLNVNLDPPCTDSSSMRKYLNNPEVKKAIHVRQDLRWDICNDEVNANYVRQYSSMKDVYLYLNKHVRGLIYNGDVDMACNFLGDEWFADSLGLEVLQSRRTWFHSDQVGGFVKRFQNLDLVTVRGAGHMVPTDKPGPAYKMINSFLNQYNLAEN